MKFKKINLLILFYFIGINSTDMYFCTAADSTYFNCLLNLIGSIHKTNFENLKELAIFDLGLSVDQIQKLGKMQKIKIYKIELTHKDLLKPFKVNEFKSVKGWYAWKPVIIKQALEIFPYVLYVDAGTTILKNLDTVFEFIKQNGHFLTTIGDQIENNSFARGIKWQTTQFLIDKFQLRAAQKQWIMNQEAVSGSPIGVSQESKSFIMTLFELSKDLKNFEDDGTTPEGFGTARHDQALLSIIAYLDGLKVLRQDFKQECPIYLTIDNKEIPFYVTWHQSYVDDKTHIYQSRSDMKNINEYLKYIRYNDQIY